MTQSVPPVVLCILDGWGLSETRDHNAVELANTPNFDALWRSGNHPTARLYASGEHVGLPDGQMGNSEVGHLNLGAGRVVRQTLPRMTKAFADGSVPDMDAFTKFVSQAKAGTGTVHLMGLASDGGVHAHSNHIVSLDQLLTNAGFDVRLHLWSDGRDVAPHDAVDHWPELFGKLDKARVDSVCGRYFALDRDNRWDRVGQAYNAMVKAQAKASFDDPLAYIDEHSKAGTGDEFIPAGVRAGFSGIQPGDSVVVANFRSDRVREILMALLDPDFDGFDRGEPVKLASTLAMTPYSDQLSSWMNVLFWPEELKMGLGETLEAANKTQFRLAETEKYPHVTFFFSGGQEQPYQDESRHMAKSPKVATYDLQPEMSCPEVGDTLAKVIREGAHDAVICNFANPDMVGHTGDLQAAIAACEAVDQQLGKAIEAAKTNGARLLVTADHGNCEQMWDPETNGPHTAHTTNLVPLALFNAPATQSLDPAGGALCDIAPTMLALLGVDQPEQMTGRSLLVAR